MLDLGPQPRRVCRAKGHPKSSLGRVPSSWWDALRIAAAQVLRTEDRQPGQGFGAVEVVNPFASPDRTPEETLAALAS